MFRSTLLILSSTASFGIPSNIFYNTSVFDFKVVGYKKPPFKVFAHKDFLFKTSFKQMVLKYGVCFVRLQSFRHLVQAQSSGGLSKITLHANLTHAVL